MTEPPYRPWPTFDMDAVEFMGRPMQYDKEGTPISIRRWGELREDEQYHRVGLDTSPALEDLDGDVGDMLAAGPVATISTVWLGIDHGWGRGLPIIFETMIFGGEYDLEQMRYATEEQAAQGHSRVVEDLRAGRPPWWLTEE